MSQAVADAGLRQRKGEEEAENHSDNQDDASGLTLKRQTSLVDGTGFDWLDAILDYFGIEITRATKKNRKKGVGTSKYHLGSLLSIETMWLFTLGITGEAYANVFIPKLLEVTGSGVRLASWLPDKVDAVMVVLNITGSFLEGVGEYSSRVLLNITDLPLLLLFRGGFCSVYTTFVGIVENGALLAPTPEKGLIFLACMIFAGVIANEFGRIFVSVLTIRKQAPTEYKIMETEWDDRVFLFCVCSILLSVTMCVTGWSEYPLSELFWGIAWVPAACLMGTWVETAGWRRWLHTHLDDHEEVFQGVQWGTWRCNTAAGLILVACYASQGIVPHLASNPCWLKFVGTFLGALSAFNGTTTDTVLLWKAGKRTASVNNALANFLCLGAMLVLLNHLVFNYFTPPDSEDWQRNVYGEEEAGGFLVFRVVRRAVRAGWQRLRAAIAMRVS